MIKLRDDPQINTDILLVVNLLLPIGLITHDRFLTQLKSVARH